METRFRDRTQAGQVLARRLGGYRGRKDVLVLALPRGGVPVAYEVARALGTPLDVFVVRKLGVPGHEELAMGAIAAGGARVLNQSVIDATGITQTEIERAVAAEEPELRRRARLYREDRPFPTVRGRTVIVVDDGLATGSTMHAAVAAIRSLDPQRIVIAVPVAPPETVEALQADVDEVVAVATPELFFAIGQYYDDFRQTTDEEVRELLARSAVPRASAGGALMLRDDDALLTMAIAEQASLLRGERADFDPLLDLIGDARFVLLGEASHGTHEFYRARAEITKRLIAEKGFSAVAAEADWPDAYRVNRFVHGATRDADATDALGDFRRFPQWMWRNADVLDFVGWLREHNDRLPAGVPRAGFYGLDLYSLHASMAAVLDYLDSADPDAARCARYRYACFEDFGEDPQSYGYAAGFAMSASCEDEVVAQLVDLQRRRGDLLARNGTVAEDEFFAAEQNARVVKDAEEYYRATFRGRISSWNLRDTHMADTFDALVGHLGRRGRPKIVVWAHNSHLGDARYTEMGNSGELNLGQLLRERHGKATVLVGFTTYTGTVSAASDWGGPVERKRVRRAIAGSYERLFHEVAVPRFLLDLRHLGEVVAGLAEPRLERAIGVIYKPETERVSHYLSCTLPRQFDAVLHFDETRAVEPLERTAGWVKGELPETYPEGV